jgi:hypothetical protein
MRTVNNNKQDNINHGPSEMRPAKHSPLQNCYGTRPYSFISSQPLGRFSRNQSPVRRPLWPWHAAS